MAFKIGNPRTKRVLQLLAALATPHEPFLQPWEYDKWIAGQEEVFLELYRKHQDNKRVVGFLAEINGSSRMDNTIADSVRRACQVAPRYLELVLKDVDEELFEPSAPKTGDPATDLWAKDAQVVGSDGFGSEWTRTAVRERNKGIELTVDFRGYVAEKR